MAQSFLNITGFPLGLRNNNPGNLRPLSGGVKWVGEIESDSINNFSRFQDIAYGIRAMITDITGDIVNDGKNTLRKLISAYAPPSENNTNAYITTVSSLTGLGPDQLIPVNESTIRKIILAKFKVELGPQYAAMISSSDINEGFSRLSDKVKGWMNYTGSGSVPSIGLFFIIAGVTTYLLTK